MAAQPDTTPFKVGQKGSDLWTAVLKGEFRKVDGLLRRGGDITFMKDNKSILTLARELEKSHEGSGETLKVQQYKSNRAVIENKLNWSVMADIEANNLDRLRTLAKVNADFYQNGQVLLTLAKCVTIKPEVLSFVLSASPSNDRYLEVVQADGRTNAGYVIGVAKGQKNDTVVMAIKQRINAILLSDAEGGNLARVQALLKLGSEVIDLKQSSANGNTALMLAAKHRRAEVVSVLLEAGADIRQVNREKKSARDLCGNDVRITAMLDKLGLVTELRGKIEKNGASLTPEQIGNYLDRGVQVNGRDNEGNTILSLAVRYKCSKEVLTNLVATYHADPNLLNRYGTGPVEAALVYRDAETLKCLFAAGVNIKRGRNMLLKYAEAHGFAGSCELIKEELCNLLWNAVDVENIAEVTEMLTNCGAYVDEITHREGFEGWTVLFLAAHKNNLQVAKFLCLHQAKVDIRSKDGKTALSVAVQAGHKNIVLYLISEGASVNTPDIHGNTPLSLAVKAAHLPLVQILLHAGADPYHQHGGGGTVAEMALTSPNKNIVYIFEHLDFTTAIPDWVEDKPPPNYDAKRREMFCLPPLAFDQSAPALQQMVPRGNEKLNKKFMEGARNLKANQVKQTVAEGADIRFVDKYGKLAHQYVQERLTRIQAEPVAIIQEKRTFQVNQENAAKDIVKFLTTKLNEQIWHAVLSEDLERVQTLHQCGAPLNWCTPQLPLGLPGLLASSQDKPEILSYLIFHCNTNAPTLRVKDAKGQTILSLAEERGFKYVSSWVRAKMTYNLHLALNNKDIAAAKQILQLGSGPELARNDGETHLHQAIETGDLELVNMLLKAGADAGMKHRETTLIELARIKGLHQISRALNTSLSTQQLFLAATGGDLAGVQKHHMAGGRIDSQSFRGITPLKLVIDSGKTQIVHYLTSRGASLVPSKTSHAPIGQLDKLSYNVPLQSYIQRSVDEQFLATVIEGDMRRLEHLLHLGANIKYANPNSSETAVSLCINYHSVDLLKFLADRGAVLADPADGKGNYALGIAAARGNTAVVEYLIREININKTIRNHDGKTPLDIAQNTDHQEVVRLLGGEVKDDNNSRKYKPPKYKLEDLLEAVKKCNMDIIKEFLDEIYSRRDLKVRHCVEMWKVSQRANQKEIEKRLARHYQELIEDTSEHKLTGSAESQVILTGFLRSLSTHITGSALDPNDPRSYDVFFQNMDQKAEEARQRIMVDDLQQLKAQFQEDLAKVQEELAGLQQQRENMQSRDREYYERITQMQVQLAEEKSARERDRIRKEMIAMQDDLNILHAQQKILEDQEKRQLNHSKISKKFEAISFNLLHFYRTIYLGVEEIFLGAKAIASGMAMVTGGSLATKAKAIDLVGGAILSVFQLEPLVGGVVAGLAKFALKASSAAMKDIDKFRQKEIGQYISCLATVGEQTDICTDVAYRLTLWYSDQIQCLAEPSDTSKTSVSLHAPARRMAQLAVGVMYTSLREKKIEKDKAADLPTLAEKLVWCVVAGGPQDGTIAKLQQCALAVRKKVTKGPTGTGYLASKVPPNFIEIEVTEANQKNGAKTWMLRDIFHKCGIVDKDGNLYDNKDCEPETYKYCYGTEPVAIERGLTVKDEKVSAPDEDLFVKDDVLVVYGKSTSAQFYLAPGKIDERVHSVLESENLSYDKMETKWKEQINELENEISQRTIKLEDRQSFLESELRDEVKKIDEVAEEKTNLHENDFHKYQGQLLGKYNELKTKMEAEFVSVFKKMQADTRKEFDTMQKKFAKKEQELDATFAKSEAKLNEHYAETEKRLEAETKSKVAEMESKMKQFCDTTRKETVQNFKFSKDQMDMFIKDQVKEIKRIEQEAIANLEAKTMQYKQESEKQVNAARHELINIVEQRTANHLKQITTECAQNMQNMVGMVDEVKSRLNDLEEIVRTLQSNAPK